MSKLMAKVVTFMAIDLTARHSYVKHNNATIQCIFTEQSGILNSSFNTKWMILAQLFNSISIVASATGAFEFICSQSPYSMRGLLFGAAYGSVVFYCVVGYGIMQPFTKKSISAAWGTQESSIVSFGTCFWYCSS